MDSSILEEDRTLLGHLLETFVLQELERQASASEQHYIFHHFRSRDGEEVDIVVQRGIKWAGVEVKASSTIKNTDFKGLRKLKELVGKNFVSGTLFYRGDRALSFNDNLRALPLESLWTI